MNHGVRIQGLSTADWNDSVAAAKTTNFWGAYQSDHQYVKTVTTGGGPLKAYFQDVSTLYGDNRGTIIVDVYRERAPIWDGGGSDNNFSTAANWVGDVVPYANETIIFNATSSKPAVVDQPYTFAGVTATAGYASTITMNAALTINGPTSLTALTLAAGPGKLDANGSVTLEDVKNGATFTVGASKTVTVQGGTTAIEAGGTLSLPADAVVNKGAGQNPQISNKGKISIRSGVANQAAIINVSILNTEKSLFEIDGNTSMFGKLTQDSADAIISFGGQMYGNDPVTLYAHQFALSRGNVTGLGRLYVPNGGSWTWTGGQLTNMVVYTGVNTTTTVDPTIVNCKMNGTTTRNFGDWSIKGSTDLDSSTFYNEGFLTFGAGDNSLSGVNGSKLVNSYKVVKDYNGSEYAGVTSLGIPLYHLEGDIDVKAGVVQLTDYGTFGSIGSGDANITTTTYQNASGVVKASELKLNASNQSSFQFAQTVHVRGSGLLRIANSSVVELPSDFRFEQGRVALDGKFATITRLAGSNGKVSAFALDWHEGIIRDIDEFTVRASDVMNLSEKVPNVGAPPTRKIESSTINDFGLIVWNDRGDIEFTNSKLVIGDPAGANQPALFLANAGFSAMVVTPPAGGGQDTSKIIINASGTLMAGGTVGAGQKVFIQPPLVQNGGQFKLDKFNLPGGMKKNGGVTTLSGSASIGTQAELNGGTFQIDSGGALEINGTGLLLNSGSIQLDGGSLSAVSGGIFVGSGAHLSGRGNLSGTLTNAGTISATGLVVDGDYTQTASGTLSVDLHDTSNPFSVTGQATLAGTLSISLPEGSATGDGFVVLTASGGWTGDFVSLISGDPIASDPTDNHAYRVIRV